MPVADLPARWESQEWLSALEAWLVPALDAVGVHTTGCVVRDRVRFWSVVARVETDAGRVWVKENAPSQAFEAGLVEVVDALVPDAVATPLATDHDRGWLATADLGLPMWHDDDAPPVPDWVDVVQAYAGVQQVLADHAAAVLAAGVPTFPESGDDVVGWVQTLVDTLRALPEADPRRLDDAETAAVLDGLPRISAAAERLAASGIPSSLQHNDLHLGNAFRRPGGAIAFIDLGDALWTHPLTSARIPLWIMRNRFGLAPDSPEVNRAVDASSSPGPTAGTAPPCATCSTTPSGSRACTGPSRGAGCRPTCRSPGSTSRSCARCRSGSWMPRPPTRTPRPSPADPPRGPATGPLVTSE